MEEALLTRFRKAVVNANEQRRLRAGLYSPLMALVCGENGALVHQLASPLVDQD
jgi:type I restriction enzyme, R subunit